MHVLVCLFPAVEFLQFAITKLKRWGTRRPGNEASYLSYIAA